MRFMSNYEIEVGENSSLSKCKCCGNKSFTGHGFVYKDGDAYAVYYVGWSTAHAEKKVSFALAIGEWDDDSTSDVRTCFGFEAYKAEEEILFRVIDPEESPWPKTDLMGEMILRNKSLEHHLLKEVFVIAEEVVRKHTAVREYLKIPIEI